MKAGGGDEYKRTLFDRRGPEAAHFLQAASSLIIPIVGGAFIGGALALRPGTTYMLQTGSSTYISRGRATRLMVCASFGDSSTLIRRAMQ